MSAPYLDQRTQQHQIYRRGNGLVDTAYYVNINTHENSIPPLTAVGNFMGNGHCFVCDALAPDELLFVARVVCRFLRGSD
jgi:hypothetical protein